ncbi:unnamed protein product [Urochloa decumbens]|uniref:Uncharacterized protein n=1 Tax=Urochloa decumbens TaxID=240449 RepID=A0ABC9GSP4_9POAL
MVSKFAFAALVLLVVVSGELGHAVPLRRGLGLGWMNGMRGGSPGGRQPSETKLQATVGKRGKIYKSEEEARFGSPVPAIVRPPRIPPS